MILALITLLLLISFILIKSLFFILLIKGLDIKLNNSYKILMQSILKILLK